MKCITMAVCLVILQVAPTWVRAASPKDDRSERTLVGSNVRSLLRSVVISSDGSKVAAGDQAGFLYVFDVSSGGEPLVIHASDSPILALAFNRDGSWIAAAGPLKMGFRFIPDPVPPLGDRPTPDASRIGDKKAARSTANVRRKGAARPPLISSGRPFEEEFHEGLLKVWDVRDGRLVRTVTPTPEPLFGVSFNAKDRELSAIDRKYRFHQWETRGWRYTPGFGQGAFDGRIPVDPLPMVFFSDDASRAVSMNVDKLGRRATLKLWDCKARRFRLEAYDGKAPTPFAVAMEPSGDHFTTAGFDGSVSHWDFDRRDRIRTYKSKHEPFELPQFVCYSPDGARIVSVDVRGRVRVWDVRSGDVISAVGGPVKAVRALAFVGKKLRFVSGGFKGEDRGLQPLKESRFEPLVVLDIDLIDDAARR